MKHSYRLFAALALLALLLSFATPAYAFDGRTGDNMVIQAGEVIDDDLYVGAQTFTLEGTVNGDLIVGAQTVIINGTVNGDLIAGAQTVVINGTVSDDTRIFAAAVQLGERAQVGSDLIAMAASVETKQGSSVGTDLVTGSGQTLLAGSVGGDVTAGTSALEIRGPITGDVKAYVNVNQNTATAQPLNMYLTDSPISLPAVRPGLNIAKDASIGGNLDYTSTLELSIPAGVVAGKVHRLDVTEARPSTPHVPTSGERVSQWVFGLLRSMITLVLFGLLVGWLFPRFMQILPRNLKDQPLISLGWGAILYAAVFFTVLVLILLTAFLVIIGLRWNIFWLGWLALSAVGIGFILISAYLTKVVVGEAVGRWILERLNSPLAQHKIWPMVIGVVTLVVLIGVLRFPLLPLGFFGWLLNFVVILFGLGALWIWGRSAWAARRAAPIEA